MATRKPKNPELAAAASNIADGEHTLQAAIVDKAGAVLIESEPVRFYVHRATVGEVHR